MWDRNQMAARAAKEIKNGMYVNLGIGIPTLVSNFISNDINITLQSENGMLGMGPFPTKENVDPDLINAGKQTITELEKTSYFSSADSMFEGAKFMHGTHELQFDRNFGAVINNWHYTFKDAVFYDVHIYMKSTMYKM